MCIPGINAGSRQFLCQNTLTYYGASISGISAVFSAANSVMGIPVNSLFSTADIPDYKTYSSESWFRYELIFEYPKALANASIGLLSLHREQLSEL